MKAKTFENLIRKVVREEIDYALRREIKSLKEDLRDEIKPIIKEQPTPTVSNNVKNTLKERIMGKQKFKPQSFAKNTALNDLLNETARGDTNTESGNAPVMPIEAMPTPVKNVVTRDYRELMRAIDKKKNNK